MTPTIVRTIARASPGDVTRLGAAGVATVHEAQGRSGLFRPYMRPVFPAARVAGSAVTVLCAPGDNLMIHAAIAVVAARRRARDGTIPSQPMACSASYWPNPASPTELPAS